MKMSQALVCSLVAIGASAPLSYADNTTDLYFQESLERYFEYPQNARTFGVAGSSVMTATDSSSVIGNPAGLGKMHDGEFSASYGYNRISGDEYPTGADVEQLGNSGSVLFAMPIGPREYARPKYGNFGLGWTQLDANWDNDTFNTDSERTQVVAAYAYALSDRTSIGYSFGWTDDKFQAQDISNYPMASGFRHTLGGHWQLQPDIKLGSAVFIGHGEHHALFGPGIEGDSETRQYGAEIGTEFELPEAMLLTVSADYRHVSTDGEIDSSIPANVVGGDENGNLFNIRAGIDMPVMERLRVRGGYRYAGLSSYKFNRVELNSLNGSAYHNAFTLGAGTYFPVDSKYVHRIELDYGVEYRTAGDDDWQHLVTLAVPFDACMENY